MRKVKERVKKKKTTNNKLLSCYSFYTWGSVEFPDEFINYNHHNINFTLTVGGKRYKDVRNGCKISCFNVYKRKIFLQNITVPYINLGKELTSSKIYSIEKTYGKLIFLSCNPLKHKTNENLCSRIFLCQ